MVDRRKRRREEELGRGRIGSDEDWQYRLYKVLLLRNDEPSTHLITYIYIYVVASSLLENVNEFLEFDTTK